MTDLHDIESLWLLGCGNMGSALLDGWIAGGLRPAAVTVIDPAMPSLPEGVTFVATLPEDGAPQILIAAVKPQVAQAILKPLSPRMAAGGTLLLSIMAGIDCDSLRAMSGAAHIVRAMPNTPARVGKGVTGLWADGAGAVDRSQAEALMRAAGSVVWLDSEDQFDALTAVSGSGPAYVFHFIEALTAAGVAAGLAPALAEALARGTVFGASTLAETSGTSAAELRRQVTSPNGTTAAGLAALDGDAHALTALLQQTVDAAAARSRALAAEARASVERAL